MTITPAPHHRDSLQDVRLLLVANPGVVHIGTHLARAAAAMGIPVRFLDMTTALSPNLWVNRFYLRFRHQPPHLGRFSEQVLDACRSFRPTVLLSTGISPIDSAALRAIRRLGIRTCNYSTDDPFNPVHLAGWFVATLPEYDFVFTPRRANEAELQASGCGQVIHEPFAYAPEIHFPEEPAGPDELARFSSDVFFAGAADADRVPIFSALIREGLKVSLYGLKWHQYRDTRESALGHADAQTGRKAAAGAKLALCLVRRANRDGHSMRSFELPAMRACMVVEDTAEHREMFGPAGQAVEYFGNTEELIRAVNRLIGDEVARIRLAEACHGRICGGRNTYKDRLADMLSHALDCAITRPESLMVRRTQG